MLGADRITRGQRTGLFTGGAERRSAFARRAIAVVTPRRIGRFTRPAEHGKVSTPDIRSHI